MASIDYNPEGWVASVTDPLKRTVRFEHDAVGRVSKRILPDGSELRIKYDANGHLVSITPPGRPSHSFQYTPIGKVAAYVPPNVDGAIGKHGLWNSITSFLAHIWHSIKFYVRKLFRAGNAAAPAPDEVGPGDKAYKYNGDGQLTKVLQPSESNVEFAYDKGGRLTAMKGPGAESSITYDPKTALPASVSSSDGVSLVPTYDGSLLTHMEWKGPIKGTVTFTYDNNLR